MSKVKCDHNCFECNYADCINDEITLTEIRDQEKRDRAYTTYGTAVVSKSKKGKHKYSIRC